MIIQCDPVKGFCAGAVCPHVRKISHIFVSEEHVGTYVYGEGYSPSRATALLILTTGNVVVVVLMTLIVSIVEIDTVYV